ncbi:MAG: hypothetical protein LH474_13310 [Chamaesiphon sp.]|nr:hypothetical protein [Chamaesiphon sp.]
MNTSTSDFTTILNQAAQSVVGGADLQENRPTKEVMVNALQSAEIFARRDKLVIPFESLIGEWRLCFATGAKKDKQRGGIKLGSGFYFPKVTPASIAFTQDSGSLTGTATNKLIVAAVQFKFTGPCRYLGKKNLLAFDFTQIQLKILGATIYQGKIRSGKRGGKDFEQLSIANLPFFAFFWAGEHSIAARGRGGGLALWVRD